MHPDNYLHDTRIGNVVPHGVANVDHVFQVMEIVYYPTAIFIDEIDSGWRICVSLIDREGDRSTLDLTQ